MLMADGFEKSIISNFFPIEFATNKRCETGSCATISAEFVAATPFVKLDTKDMVTSLLPTGVVFSLSFIKIVC